MYFDLNDDQRTLTEAVEEFCGDVFPIELTRAWGEPGGVNRTAWRQLADIGTFTMAQPAEPAEPDGPDGPDGPELGIIEAALVFQTLGACLVPGPLVPAALAAELYPAVADGDALPALAIRPPAGAPLLVDHLDGADLLLVLEPDGIYEVPAHDVDATRLEQPLDPTTPLSLVTRLPPGERVADTATARRWYRHGSLLSSALLAGNAVRVTEIAADYARIREQFGRPIATFQAVKHMLADAFAHGELARAAVDAAAVTSNETADISTTRRAIATARIIAAEAAISNAKTAIQVHGGMGFTWETTPHLYLKRAITNQTAFTTPHDAAESIIDGILPQHNQALSSAQTKNEAP
jgi:alkylation response protein AidB-like acyl-CoA dehydrogenase